MRRAALAALAFALAAAALVAPAGAQEFPGFNSPVVDAANVVPVQIEQRLNAALLDYQERSTNQIAVALVDTTGDQSIEDYTIDLAREWGVGTAEEDNGVLLLIAVEDREYRFEVGQGLEGDLTDSETGRIGRDHLVPRLRQGDYGGAVEVATQEIRRELGDDQVGAAPAPVAPAAEESDDDGGFPFLGLLFLGFFLFSVIGGAGKRRRGRRWGIGAPIIWGGGFGGGGFGGGGGGGFGGGFGGGGGGGFSGGGSSGSW